MFEIEKMFKATTQMSKMGGAVFPLHAAVVGCESKKTTTIAKETLI